MPGPAVGILAGLALFPAAGAIVEPYVESLRQISFNDLPTRLLTAEQYALAARRGLIEPKRAQELVQRLGISSSHFNALLQLQRNFVSPETYIALMRRGNLSPAEAQQLVLEQGYLPYEWDAMEQSSLIIPGVQDLITMAVRGAFNPEEVSTFQLDEAFPEEVAEWAARQGLSREWAIRYWRSHWQLPSPQQVLEALHRGKVDEKVVDIYLRAADYSPFWRDMLKSISYSPLTRVDTRRLRKDNIIDFEQVKQEYRNQGYDEQRATWLAEWTEKDVKREKRVELKDLTDGLRSTVLTGIVNGSFTEDEGRSYLEALGYETEEISDFIMYARTVREERIRARIIERVGDLYVKERATEEEVRAYLGERGFTAEEASLRLEEWSIERELRAPTEQEEKERDLTKAEIIASYKEGLDTRAEAEENLTRMRYSPDEVETLLGIADAAIQKVVQKEQIEVVKNRVLRGQLGETDAITALDGLGIRESQRNALVSSWFRQLEAKVFDLPLSMVQDMYARTLITEDEAREYLSRLGATEKDAARVLALWGNKNEEKRLRAEQAAAKKKA